MFAAIAGSGQFCNEERDIRDAVSTRTGVQSRESNFLYIAEGP